MSLVTAVVAPSLSLADPADLYAPSGREEPHVQALLEAARRGDREAFGDLITLHQRVVFRTALAALGRAEDAEDAAQEAFVVAWRKLGDFRGASTFRTWLLTIVWRKALDRRRVRRLWWTRTQEPVARDVEQDPLSDLPTSWPTPEQQAVSADRSLSIRQEIDRLSPKLRDTLLLAMSGEHAYEEIARLQGIPLGTVKWRVSEARRILSQRLEP